MNSATKSPRATRGAQHTRVDASNASTTTLFVMVDDRAMTARDALGIDEPIPFQLTQLARDTLENRRE